MFLDGELKCIPAATLSLVESQTRLRPAQMDWCARVANRGCTRYYNFTRTDRYEEKLYYENRLGFDVAADESSTMPMNPLDGISIFAIIVQRRRSRVSVIVTHRI